MAEILDLDAEFSEQMQGLAQQAEQAVEGRVAAARKADEERDAAKQSEERALKAYQTLPEVLRPLVLGLQAVGRATGENTQILNKLDKALEKPAAAPEETDAHKQMLPKAVADLQAMVEQKNSISRMMFDALHEELRSYKDGFLLDSVHRPMIRDLISLYDDMTEIHRQMQEAIAEKLRQTETATASTLILERLKGIEMHIEHNREFIIEVLARLEVTQLPAGTGKLDRRTQRAVAVEMAEDPDEDTNVVRSVKRGFLWKDRVVRPEEVVIKKWKEGFLVALQPAHI